MIKDLFHNSKGDATMSLLLLIILVSGVFLVGGVAPKMHDDTLDMASTGVVEGVKSEDSAGNSFAASAGTNNESKKSLQMKQLILTTATPTPVTPTPTRAPTPTPTPAGGSSGSPSAETITFTLSECETIKNAPAMKGKITVTGAAPGYLAVEKELSTPETYSGFAKILFNPSQTTYNLFLTESDAVFGKKLRAKLFYTPGKIGELSGGTESAAKVSETITCI